MAHVCLSGFIRGLEMVLYLTRHGSRHMILDGWPLRLFDCARLKGMQHMLWCTKRVKSTDTGRPVFQKYGSTRKNTGRPVNLRVDPYFRYGSTRIFAGRPVFLRVDPYFYGSTRIFAGRPVYFRVDPYIYGSTRILRVYLHLRVDP